MFILVLVIVMKILLLPLENTTSKTFQFLLSLQAEMYIFLCGYAPRLFHLCIKNIRQDSRKLLQT